MQAQPPESRIKYFPVSFFAMVMGLTGLSIAWHKAEQVFSLQLAMSGALLVLAAAVFGALALLYGLKLVRFRASVAKELGHPIQLNFFPAISISLILLGIATLQHWAALAGILWIAGTTLHLLLTLYILGVWVHQEHFEIHHINPAWFIPVVGNVLVPIAGVPLGFTEISWFFFSVGILFWLLLFAIILYRVLFHQPLPERLMPTFFILIAPPAVGFIAYVQLGGELDAFARVLYYAGLFLTLLLATQAPRFLRLEFYLSWWAYSFPLAAMATATLLMFQLTQLTAFAAIGWLLLSAVSLVVVYLLYRTAKAVGGRHICIPAV